MNIGNHTPYQNLFDNLVGSEAALASFEAQLADEASSAAYDAKLDDVLRIPKRMDTAFANLIKASTNQIYEEIMPMQEAGIITDVRDLCMTAGVGLMTYVYGLSSMGEVYERNAKVPQRPETVLGSVQALSRSIFGVAFSGDFSSGSRNLIALGTGLNPHGRPVRLIEAAEKVLGGSLVKPSVSTRSFKHTDQGDGQLDVRLRHKTVKANGAHGRCPAAYAKVENGPAKIPGLLQMLNSIGGVAVRDIYPSRFAMTG